MSNVSKLFRLFISKNICGVHVNFGLGCTYFFLKLFAHIKNKGEAPIIMNLIIIRKMLLGF